LKYGVLESDKYGAPQRALGDPQVGLLALFGGIADELAFACELDVVFVQAHAAHGFEARNRSVDRRGRAELGLETAVQVEACGHASVSGEERGRGT